MNDAYEKPRRRRAAPRSRGAVIPFRPRGTGNQFPSLPGLVPQDPAIAHALTNKLRGQLTGAMSNPQWYAQPSPWLSSIPRDETRNAHVPGFNDRKVRWDEGPPWPTKTYNQKNWYRQSDGRKLKLLRKYAKEYGRDMRLRQFVINFVLTPAGATFPSRQWAQQQSAILKWIQTNVAYINEPGELLQGPWHTLKVKSGDCDDMALLGAAMAESIMLPWRFVLAGRRAGRPTRWAEGTPKPYGTNFQHIYLDFGEPAGKPRIWRAAEPTMNVPLGFDVVKNAADGGGRIDAGPGHAGWGDYGLSLEQLPPAILGVPATELPEFAGTWGKRIIAAAFLAISVRLMVDKVWKNRRFKKTFKV